MTSLSVLREMRAELSERLDAINSAIAALERAEELSEKKERPAARRRGAVFTSDPAAGNPDRPVKAARGGGGIRLDQDPGGEG